MQTLQMLLQYLYEIISSLLRHKCLNFHSQIITNHAAHIQIAYIVSRMLYHAFVIKRARRFSMARTNNLFKVKQPRAKAMLWRVGQLTGMPTQARKVIAITGTLVHYISNWSVI